MSAIAKLIAGLPIDPNYDTFLEELDATGYAIVPKVATDEMVEAGWCDGRPGSLWETYRRMLAAAPKVGE
jgi:hypothetical protein